MTHKRTAFRLRIVALLLFSLFIGALILFSNRILSKNHPIDAKVLVIEGWLPAYDLELLPKEIDLNRYETIIVTGIAHNRPDYLTDDPNNVLTEMPVKLFKNGCLGIQKTTLEKIKSLDSISEIKVFAYGSEALGKFAHFIVAIGDSIIGSAFVNEQSATYVFHTQIKRSQHQGIFIYFNNDIRFNKEDRNLIIDSVSVNGLALHKPSDFYKIYDAQIDDNLYTNYPFRSNAVAASYYLKTLGIHNIITIDTFFNKRNKTLAAARKVEFYLNRSLKNVNAFNVVSINRHSRRSYLAYNIATSHKKKIGIISLRNMNFYNSTRTKKWIYDVIDEYAKTFVTFIEYLIS